MSLTSPVSLLDVPPTVLHALGAAIPSSYPGRPLHEAFVGEAAEESAGGGRCGPTPDYTTGR
jgi:arylsulfatase A-like enzyme